MIKRIFIVGIILLSISLIKTEGQIVLNPSAGGVGNFTSIGNSAGPLPITSTIIPATSSISLGGGAQNFQNLILYGNIFMAPTGFAGSGNVLISGTLPTVTSAGASPSVAGATGSNSFRVNVGTGGSATTIVMAMPSVTTGWNCTAQNITANAANRAGQHVVLQSSTTTAVTVQNQTVTTGAALAFAASDIVAFNCLGY